MRVYHYFFWYTDPDQRFLMRIRIRANDTDPTGSGSETLLEALNNAFKFLLQNSSLDKMLCLKNNVLHFEL